ncbi:hypothetical protein [Rhizobium sp. R693]|uniref:hypothetical protein n=1 Tax=Rhizobium sp. R693 TaxID=1764276 RepID=UPI000B52A4CB|nr:hypothetical protein [Rhizobium sp. R693]OWV85772.1 hypothetical protein ATY79_29635 [Rhizobium sp. R693]
MLKSFLVLAAIAGTTSYANAACISEAKLKSQMQTVNGVLFERELDGAKYVTIYKRKDKNYLAVERQSNCIATMRILDEDELWSSYQAEDESDCEECVGIVADSDALAPEPSSPAQFEHLSPSRYAVTSVYNGPIHRPDFKGRDKGFADFRSRILEGMSQGVNFSGDYTITQIGCGSSCSFAILSNLRTGEQFDFPRGGEEVGPLSLKFSANSSLMISTWKSGEDCVLESLQFDGKKWVTLAKPSLGKADLCYDGIDDNIERYKSRNGASDNSSGSSLVQGGSSPADVSPGIPSRTEIPGDKTAFRGLRLGMSKEQAMSLHIDGFSPELREKVEYEGGFKIPSHVNFLSASGDICASGDLGDGNPVIEELELSECFFLSKGANLHQFTKKFADSYNVGSMAGSVKQRNSSAIEESYEGETKFGEVIKIYKVTGFNNKLNKVEDPIKVNVKSNNSTFD